MKFSHYIVFEAKCGKLETGKMSPTNGLSSSERNQTLHLEALLTPNVWLSTNRSEPNMLAQNSAEKQAFSQQRASRPDSVTTNIKKVRQTAITISSGLSHLTGCT